MDNLLKSADINTYPLFSLKGHISKAKLLSNYDGDTGDLLFIYDNKPMRMKARFYGYDCNEMKPSINDPKRDEKKKKAIEAKERLWFLCTNNNPHNLIKIKCYDFDKYGRILINAFYENCNIEDIKNEDELFELSINKIMIDEGHGYKYYGGTKNQT
jgi:endonuclease YncB( thermonuclease family)